MTKSIDSLYSFRLLGQACVGVLLGALFAMLLAGVLWPVGGKTTVIPDGLLPWTVDYIFFKPREKGFYLLSMLFGFIGAYLTTTRLWRLRLLYLYLGLIASIPISNFLAGRVLQENDSFLKLSLLLIILVLFSIFVHRKGRRMVPVSKPTVSNLFQWKFYLIFLLVITALLLPASFTEVAAHVGMDLHVVVFIIGPALYFLGDHLLPGIDYFSQYSVGMGWLFSHILSSTAEHARVNYTYFVIIAMWLFYAQIFYLLHWLYRSWVPTVIVCLLSLILLFHGRAHFVDPSSNILRYPLFGVCAWLLARYAERSGSIVRHLFLAAGIALSIFFNTETGIIFALAATLAYLLSERHFYPALLSVVGMGIASVSFLLLLLVAVFGHRVLQFDFLYSLVEALLIYGQIGFGGFPISWTLNDLNWFYNLVAPGIVLATLALIARTGWNTEGDRPRLTVLAFFAIAGLFMQAKYVNRSLVGVWQMSTLGLLVPFGWWAMMLARRFKNSILKLPLLDGVTLRGSSIVWAIAIIATVRLAAFSNDVSNSADYGLRSWVYYPSLVKSFFWKQEGCAKFDCVPNRPAAKDVALIQQRTQPGEQVAIIDSYDWAYLVSAHRPPLMFFLPSEIIFTKRDLAESLDRLQHTPYLFLPKGINKEPSIGGDPCIKNALMPTFHEKYIFDGEGERLVAWRRKDLQTSPSK